MSTVRGHSDMQVPSLALNNSGIMSLVSKFILFDLLVVKQLFKFYFNGLNS
jgi:hypothetical protein